MTSTTRIISQIFIFAAGLWLACGVHAQSYPTKPVTLVVPFAAGGPADVFARLLAQHINLGQPILIDNKAGAGGTIGAGAVAKAGADGHALLFVTAGHAGAGALYPKLGFDPVKDFAPVIGPFASPAAIAVNASSRFKTLQQFVAEAKANPGKLNCAGGGGGATVTNLALELFKADLKLQITAVPYKGSAPAATALLAGEIDCNSDNLSGLMPHVKAGKLRVLAVTSAKRAAVLPDVPTIAEAILPGFEAATWFGVLAPAGTPTAVIERLNREFNAALRQAPVVERMKDLSLEAQGGSPSEFGAFLASETRRWGGLINTLGLKAD